VDAEIVPLAPAHSALHIAAEPIRVQRYLAPMPPLIAPTAGRHDICRVIAAAVALRHEVLGSALQLSGCAR
jgi:hypothetical protein